MSATMSPAAAKALDNANLLYNSARYREALSAYEAIHQLEPSALTAYSIGLALASLNRKPEAAVKYQEAARRDPRMLQARLNLGNQQREAGQFTDALHNHLIAFGFKRDELVCLCNLGIDWLRLGQRTLGRELLALVNARSPGFAFAEFEMRDILPVANRSAPLTPELQARYDKAMRRATAGKIEAAVRDLGEIVAAEPLSALAWIDYGNQLLALGKVEDACAAQRTAIALEPVSFAAWHNLGAALIQVRPADAIQPLQVAVTLNPQIALSWRMLGQAHRDTQDLPKAWDCFLVSCDLPDAALECFAELADVSRFLRRTDEAIAAMRALEEKAPTDYVVHNNLGAFLLDLGRADDALECFLKAEKISPTAPVVHMNIGSALELKGRFREALASYTTALDLRPDDVPLMARVIHMAQHQCQWSGIEDLFARFKRRVAKRDLKGVSPFSLLAIPGVDAADQLECARQFVRENFAPLKKLAAAPVALPKPGDKINVGYLSSDLHDHATSWLLAEIIELHDRSRFYIVAYSYGSVREGPTRRRLESSFDRFHDIQGLTDEQVAAAIRHDDIHVLIDLKGYTQGTRSGILALRPSPVQINYLGFPGSLGADYVDYIIADNVVIPPELAQFYDERVLRLPGCYQPNDRKRPRPNAVTRAQAGLPPDGFVFAAFNNVYKITAEMFDVWCRLIRETPGSVLWILSSNQDANDNLTKEAVKRGVSADRLVWAPRCALPDHLARFACADVMLDTFPCAAHTTASDSLWAGVPVITCVGDTFASRVAASILGAIDMSELVARNFREYYDIAHRVVTTPGLAADLKNRVLATRDTSALFDSSSYTRHIEAAFVEAIQDTRARQAGKVR